MAIVDVEAVEAVEADGGRGRGEGDDGAAEVRLSLASDDSEKVESRTCTGFPPSLSRPPQCGDESELKSLDGRKRIESTDAFGTVCLSVCLSVDATSS